MAGEIQARTTTGATLYAIVLNANGQAWYTVTPVFEAINAAHWTSYAITMTEAVGTGLYIGTFPTAIATLGTYSALVFNQAGGSPADTDSMIASGPINWSGAASLNPVKTNSSGGATTSYEITKNAVLNGFQFAMTLSSDHISPYTGAANTITGYVNRDGTKNAWSAGVAASLAAITGSPGDYTCNFIGSDINGNNVEFIFNAPGCDTTKILIGTQA